MQTRTEMRFAVKSRREFVRGIFLLVLRTNQMKEKKHQNNDGTNTRMDVTTIHKISTIEYEYAYEAKSGIHLISWICAFLFTIEINVTLANSRTMQCVLGTTELIL